MRKQIRGNLAAINATQNQLKGRISIKKNPRYIYTEADLGEGILDAGIADYNKEQQDHLNTKPQASLFRTQWQ